MSSQVSKKTLFSVSIRFPSMCSLASYFSKVNQREFQRTKFLPALDQKHVMGSEHAGELLYRRIEPHEMALKRSSWSFWIAAKSDYKVEISSNMSWGLDRWLPKNGLCWSELTTKGMIRWGKRKRVQYLSRNVEEKGEVHSGDQPEAGNIKLDEEQGEREKAKEEEQEPEDTKEPDESDFCEGDARRVYESGGSFMRNDRKRKRNWASVHRSRQKAKKCGREKRNQMMDYRQKNSGTKVVRNFIDRWSVERYKLAEANMLKVLKEKNAVFGNPILRPALRAEARKLIGDTGLLDHLLKHMAGKVAPGGQERFRRRHNADGAMEYWLENAELMHIRKEAGVQDPYWTPPPGWKLGDSPTQDPVCAGEINKVKEEIALLKREIEMLASKKQEEEFAIAATPNSCVSQILDHDNFTLPVKDMYMDLLKRKTQIEEQLKTTSVILREMEEEIRRLHTIAQETDPKIPNSTQTPLLIMEAAAVSSLPVNAVGTTEAANVKQESAHCKALQRLTEQPLTEWNAEKTGRQKSGFKICKPKGSFLWPHSAASLSPREYQTPQAKVPVSKPDRLSGLPLTSSSTSFSTPPHGLLPAPAYPLKAYHPLTEKHSIIVTIPPLPYPHPEQTLNLNEVPNIKTETDCWSSKNPSLNNCVTGTCVSTPLTYYRRNHNHTAEN